MSLCSSRGFCATVLFAVLVNSATAEADRCQQRDAAGNCQTITPTDGDSTIGNSLFQSGKSTVVTPYPGVSLNDNLQDDFDLSSDSFGFDEPSKWTSKSFFSDVDEVLLDKVAALATAAEEWASSDTQSRGLVFDVLLGVVCMYGFLLVRDQLRAQTLDGEEGCVADTWRSVGRRIHGAFARGAVDAEDSGDEDFAAGLRASAVARLQAEAERSTLGQEEEDVWGCSRLHIAAAQGAAHEVEALLLARQTHIDSREAWGETALHFAARHGCNEVCSLLVDNGADIDATNDSDETPLLVAGKAGNELTCDLLLGQGAGLGGKTNDEIPAMLNLLLMKRLIQGPAQESGQKKPDQEDEWGCSLLHVAAAKGHETEVEALLEQGTGGDVNARDAWDETPLHFAARAGHAGVCETLIASGAGVNATSFCGKTPLIAAAAAAKEDACLILLAHGAHAGDLDDADVPPLLARLLVQQVMADGA